MTRPDWTVVRLLLGTALLAGCGDNAGGPGQGFGPTGPILLSSGSPNRDEDPTVLRAANGRMFVAWFSERSGNADIWITSTADGTTWTSPVQVTTSAGGDFDPTLIQDDSGTFHVVWFRWSAPNLGYIYHNTSPDGLTWSPAAEERVTNAFGVDDWVPTIARRSDGTLLVYFVSALRDTATQTQALPWLNPKSHLYYATSTDGLAWSTPARITNDTDLVVNLFPALFPSHAGVWSLVWLSTALGPPKVFEIPLADVALYPAARIENPLLPPSYSHHIAPTSVPGLYLGVWVQGPDGAQDIYYRFYRP